jgi:hypothetical protein
MEFLFCLFEQMLGLKINFLKSEVFCLGKCKEGVHMYEKIFTSKSRTLTFKYLWVPIDKDLNIHWRPT